MMLCGLNSFLDSMLNRNCECLRKFMVCSVWFCFVDLKMNLLYLSSWLSIEMLYDMLVILVSGMIVICCVMML